MAPTQILCSPLAPPSLLPATPLPPTPSPHQVQVLLVLEGVVQPDHRVVPHLRQHVALRLDVVHLEGGWGPGREEAAQHTEGSREAGHDTLVCGGQEGGGARHIDAGQGFLPEILPIQPQVRVGGVGTFQAGAGRRMHSTPPGSNLTRRSPPHSPARGAPSRSCAASSPPPACRWSGRGRCAPRQMHPGEGVGRGAGGAAAVGRVQLQQACSQLLGKMCGGVVQPLTSCLPFSLCCAAAARANVTNTAPTAQRQTTLLLPHPPCPHPPCR